MANIVYTNYLKQLASGTIDLITDNIYAMLVSGSYVPNTGHSYGSVVPYQSSDPLASYVSGGQLLANKTLTNSAGSIVFNADAASWSSATITASGAVIWRSGSNTVRDLITFVDIGNQSSTNGTFQIVWNSTNGIIKITAT